MPDVKALKHLSLIAALALFLCAASARAQGDESGATLAEARADLIESAAEAKATTEDLLRLKEADLEKAARAHEQLKQLAADGLVARREVEEGEASLAAARAALEELRRQAGASERLIAETEAAAEADLKAAELAKLRPLNPATRSKLLRPTLGYSSTALVIRHTGAAGWTAAAGLSGVRNFFATTFGRALPVSAHGQTATHARLGFDHSRAVDVALHPDSAEGRALMAYLQSQGITFIAFRGAVPGSSTGAHIHIGPPSKRSY